MPLRRQHLPEVRGRLVACAHHGIQANARGREALGLRFSDFRPNLSNYQRHHLWDIENNYDELKNHWGWGGFTTHDLRRCRLMAGIVALVYNWWSLFVRLADPDHHREVITSRPLLLHAVARQSRHAGQTRITVSSMHAKAGSAARALRKIAAFFAELWRTAEQLSTPERWCRILSRALIKYLKGRVLKPPGRFLPA